MADWGNSAEHGLAVWLLTWQVHATLLLGLALAAARSRWLTDGVRERWLGFAVLAPFVTATLQIWLGAAVTLPLASIEATPALAPLAALPDSVAPAVEPSIWTWPRLLLGGVLAIALASSAVWLLERQRTRRLLADRQPLADTTLRAILDHLCRRGSMRRAVRLSVSDAAPTPIAFGLLRPEICLPRDVVRRLGRRELRAVLAHELAHLRAHDSLWLGAIDLLPRLFPWQPLFWLARRRLLRLAELRCDASAARDCGGPVVARCLVEVASLVAGERPLALPAMAAHRTALRERVERLLGPAAPTRRRRRGLTAVLVPLALATATLALPGAPPPMDRHATRGPTEAATLLLALGELDAACAELALGFRALQQDLAGRRLDAAALAELREITARWNRLDTRRIEIRTRIVEAYEALDAEPQPERR